MHLEVDSDGDGRIDDPDTRYLHRDHLGSVVAVTDEVGLVHDPSGRTRVEPVAFDPFGRRLGPDWLDDPAAARAPGSPGHLDYTGQEALPEVGLIHMNGRLYDPELGVFLGPDPYIQAPGEPGNHNRYVYVLNNPLRYTDPTVYLIERLGAVAATGSALLGGVGGIALAAGWLKSELGGSLSARRFFRQMRPNEARAATFALSFIPYAGPWAAAAFSAQYTYFNTGDMGLAIESFAVSIIAGQIGNKAGAATGGGEFVQAIVSGAVAGAITGGYWAYRTGGNVGCGMLQGAAMGAATSAVISGIISAVKSAMQPSGANEVNQPSAGNTNSNSSLSARQAAAEAEIQQAIKNGTLDPNKVFTGKGNVDAAAEETLTVTHPISEKHNVEIGGRIVPNGKGVSYETPIVGDADSVYIDPNGAVAGYHTRPGGASYDYFSNKIFSSGGGRGDAGWVRDNNIPLYMSNFSNGKLTIKVCEGSAACNPQSVHKRGLRGRVVR